MAPRKQNSQPRSKRKVTTIDKPAATKIKLNKLELNGILPRADVADALSAGSESAEGVFSELVLHAALQVLVNRAIQSNSPIVCKIVSEDPQTNTCDLYQCVPGKPKQWLKEVSLSEGEGYPDC